MREIKFRGYYTGDSHFAPGWVYGSLIIGNDECTIMEAGENGSMAWSVDPESVGQYAGTKDKNGTEIYEGDIFTSCGYPFESDGNKNYVGVIEYDGAADYLAWFYAVHPISDRVRGAACGGALCELCCTDIEIIGSTHLDPELLQVVES